MKGDIGAAGPTGMKGEKGEKGVFGKRGPEVRVLFAIYILVHAYFCIFCMLLFHTCLMQKNGGPCNVHTFRV